MELKIEDLNSKRRRWRRWLVFGLAPMIVLLAIVFSMFKQCTALGRAAQPDVYDPSECGAGFVTKADSVFALLLAGECVDTSIEAIDLESLNRRYRALEFALPFGEEGNDYIESSNLRVVGIHPEYIKDESLRRFYYNSRLPQLLEQQREQLGESLFEIRCKSMLPDKELRADNPKRLHPVEVRSIKMIPSMFKVRLVKNKWTGVIESREGCLFDDTSTVYLTYGNTVLPLHSDAAHDSNNEIHFYPIMNEGIVLWKPPTASNGTPPQQIDYYEYYKMAFDSLAQPHTIALHLRPDCDSKNESASINMTYSGGHLRMSHNCGLVVMGSRQTVSLHQSNPNKHKPTDVPFEDGMKILMYTEANNKLSEKLGEITLYKHNPMRMLSYLTQTSVGTDRFFISDYQTDLFTQQLLRGLSQHLSNRENVDTVRLTIDPLLSREFENEIKQYVKQLPGLIAVDRHKNSKPATQINEQYDMSVTIMDMATGEVLATPFYTTLFDNVEYSDQLKLATRNTSLCRRSIGSTFKPMEALASVLAIPSLVNMNTTGRYGPPDFTKGHEQVMFFGRLTRPWAKNTAGHWGGCDFTTFLGRSDDVYPVGLVALALAGNTDGASATSLMVGGNDSYFNDGSPRRLLRFKDASKNEIMRTLRNQPFVQNMAHVFNVNYDERDDDALYSRTTDIDLFEQLVASMSDEDRDGRIFGLREVSPEPTQLRFDRMDDGEDFHDLLVPWVLGQGDNMWNCVKLAEAWARMIGKRDVRASFIAGNGTPKSLVDGVMSFAERQNANNTWNAFLEKFHEAQQFPKDQGGTLVDMRRAVMDLGEGLVLFSKTGTPSAYVPPIDIPLMGGRLRKMDLGMFSFVLLKSAQYARVRDNRPAHGIVCIVRVSRTYECTNRGCTSGDPCDSCKPYWGLESAHARDFFADDARRLRKLVDMTRRYYGGD